MRGRVRLSHVAVDVVMWRLTRHCCDVTVAHEHVHMHVFIFLNTSHLSGFFFLSNC